MTLRRTLQQALVVLSAAALLAACSGTDDDDDGGNITAGDEAKVSAPNEIVFPTINVGQSVTKTIEVDNTGSAPLEITKVRLKEGDEDAQREFTAGEKWKKKATVDPKDDPLELDVVYNPLNATQDSGKVVFDTNTKQNKVTVKLSPEKLAPRVNAPDTVNFSSAQPGTTVWKKFSIQNVDQAALTINKLQLQGSSLFQLTIPDEKAGGGDDKKNNNEDDTLKPEDDKKLSEVLPVTLKPDESFQVRGWFSPQDNNPEDATVTIFSNDPSGRTTVKLLGNSKAPCLGLSHQSPIRFGESSTGKISRKTVTMENCRPRSKKQLKIRGIEITDDGGGVFGLERSSLPGDLQNGNTFTLPGGDRANFVVTFTPPKNKTYSGELVIRSNDPSRTRHKLTLRGKGTDNECPTAVAKAKVQGSSLKKKKLNTLPLETIVFDGTASSDPDGSVKRYEWSIIDRPEDSTARLTPNSNVKKPKLFLDLAGKYKVELTVYDDQGTASCGNQAIVEISAIPQEDIHVQLVWDTPSDTDQTDSSGADLDLHYLNAKYATSWNESPWDIYWNNKTSDWGQENVTRDDPSLDIDDTDGAGPENVNHNNPNAQNYKVGVYYYDDHGFGPSYATVRIYVNGQLQREYKNKFLSGTFAFWKVAIINWPTGNIYPRDQKFNGFPSTP